MASVLVVEPHPEVRELLVRVVRRLGHEVVEDRGSSQVDVVVLEPAADGALEGVAPALDRGAALVCVSILPPAPGPRHPSLVAHLQKPFSLAQLERALSHAVERLPRASAA
jgi:CheY-like chemotaxis protein